VSSSGSNRKVIPRSFGWLRIPIDEALILNHWENLIRNLETEPFVRNGRTEAVEMVSDGVNYYFVKSGNPGKHFHNLSEYIHVLGEKNNVRNWGDLFTKTLTLTPLSVDHFPKSLPAF
jgi:hypothetical protein